LHDEQIRNVTDHPARQRYSFHVGNAVNPYYFGAPHFTQKTQDTTDRSACAYHNVRPFPEDYSDASQQDLCHSPRVLPVTLSHNVNRAEFSQSLSHNFGRRDAENIISIPTLNQFKQLGCMPSRRSRQAYSQTVPLIHT
jgi:hypothetical protein